MLEVTEHSVVEDYQALAEALAPLRRDGLRLAIDDAGAGYASFRHILKLMPDVIKLDQSLTRKIHRRAESRALTAALVAFAAETRITLVAEGVERRRSWLACVRLVLLWSRGTFSASPCRRLSGSSRRRPLRGGRLRSAR